MRQILMVTVIWMPSRHFEALALVAWFENTSGDGLAWQWNTITAAADGAIGVYAADLDRDGDVDVLSTSLNDKSITWYENRRETV